MAGRRGGVVDHHSSREDGEKLALPNYQLGDQEEDEEEQGKWF